MGLGRADGCLDGRQLGARCHHGSIGRVEARLLLVEQLLAGELALEDLAHALEFLAGQQQLALTQLHAGLGGGVVLASTQHFGLGLVALSFQGAGVDTGQKLAATHLVAFIDQHFGQAPGNLAGNLHLGGFEAAVAHAYAFRQLVVERLPVAQASGCRQQGDQGRGENLGGVSIHQSASCVMHGP
ncbi:hypothetical protein D3C76_819200 [compost metagenome]